MKQNNKILLKVCGMRDADNIRDVAALSPDFMGFIFYRGSKRYVGDSFTLPGQFPTTIKRVGVFVDEDTKEISRLANVHSLDFIQLHGEESAIQCAELAQLKLKIIKAFPVDEGFDFDVLKPFAQSVDYFLFDTKGESRGGTGQTFDWKLLDSYALDVPFFLSGGISIENIKRAKAMKNPKLHAFDLNSKFELEPGMKDVNLIRELKKLMTTV